VARLADVLVGFELAPQPPFARLRLLGDLLRIPPLLVGAHAARRGLGADREPARGRDVGLQAPAPLLLRLVGERDARPAPALLLAVRRVAALVGMDLAAFELEDLRDRFVEEAAVVGDDHHRARELLEERLEPGEAVEVEMVGRLVEEEDRRPRQQHAGQQGSRRLAAAQRAERRIQGHVRDAERVAGAVELRVQRPAAERAEAILLLAVRGERVGVIQPPLEPCQLAVQLPHLAQGGAEQAVDRQLRPGRLLRQVADAVAGTQRHAAPLRSVDAGQHPQERGLPRPVGTHQRDAARAGEGEAQRVEQRGLAVRDAQVRRLEQHGRSRFHRRGHRSQVGVAVLTVGARRSARGRAGRRRRDPGHHGHGRGHDHRAPGCVGRDERLRADERQHRAGRQSRSRSANVNGAG
jgi:hypothetical protein